MKRTRRGNGERSRRAPGPTPRAAAVSRRGRLRRGLTASGTASLRDGRRALLRPLTAADRRPYLAGFERLGDESRLRRFLGPKPRLSEAEVRYFTEVDHHDHEAIVAIVGDDGVGVARFIRDRDDPRVADVAVAVIDAYQRRGVGTALLRRLADRARGECVEEFRATMSWTNRPMLELIHRLGVPFRTVSSSAGVVEIRMSLTTGPTAPPVGVTA